MKNSVCQHLKSLILAVILAVSSGLDPHPR
ncbi:hypothetical protein 20Sep418_00040 [Pseudomonas phage 20Sep418]|uniref:Uncharacterized protein n=2 Tax=Pakpunavirus TaxID=1921407 RepID=A0AAF0AT08_9CAUD|nr:hypothetical protein QE325_gp196 [Pseudomonas phage pPA-3099-2aT.2]WBQ35185.1 hypothetical protein [Pseudomonas phage pPA-3099-2aT.2]WFG37204.1 hypothetical protein 9081_00100 [Pseudomonas phage bmx-p3]WFG37718.1 hypothetical protein 20Sep418_00040 [Pseudomonas phage 20Sep418]